MRRCSWHKRMILALAISGLGISVGAAEPLGRAISYQGQLEQFGAPVSGVFDFRMVAFDRFEFGDQVSPVVVFEDVEVLSGLVQLDVDFGPGVFIGERRWVQIEVREGASVGSYTPLMPRQELLPGAYALHAESSRTLGNQEIETGTIGSCQSAGASSSGSVVFASPFAAPPRVFLTADESFDNDGCIAARVSARSETGFSWSSYGTISLLACDCIHWLAIGER